MAPISYPLHHGIDNVIGILQAFVGKMEIDHGGLDVGVTEILLDDPKIDSGFEQMSGIGMATMPTSA